MIHVKVNVNYIAVCICMSYYLFFRNEQKNVTGFVKSDRNDTIHFVVDTLKYVYYPDAATDSQVCFHRWLFANPVKS